MLVVLCIMIVSIFLWKCFKRANDMPTVRKTHGGYAGIQNDPRGTLLVFRTISQYKPIVIEYTNPNGILDTMQLCNFLSGIPNAFGDRLRNAVTKPAGFINPRFVNKTISGIIRSNPILLRWIKGNNPCDLDIAIGHILAPGPRPNIALNNALTTIRRIVILAQGYSMYTLNSAYQGNIRGNARANGRFITYDGNNVVPPYRRSVPVTHPGATADPFKLTYLDNDHFRKWYGTIDRRIDPQYVRIVDDTVDPIALHRIPPDGATTKTQADEMADIIPAGSVRSSIMLLLDAWRTIHQQPNAPTIDEVLNAVSYITLLAGLANAFGNTTHAAMYNGSIGDRYGFT